MEKYPLYMHDLEGHQIGEIEAQYILSLAPPVKVKWEDIGDLFLDDSIGRSYYYTRQLQLDASIEISCISGQYKIYQDIVWPAIQKFIQVPFKKDIDTKELLYRYAINAYDPPVDRKISAIPRPAFKPNKAQMQDEVISDGYFTDDIGQRWYVKNRSEANEVMQNAMMSKGPAYKHIIEHNINPIIITPTEIFHLT